MLRQDLTRVRQDEGRKSISCRRVSADPACSFRADPVIFLA